MHSAPYVFTNYKRLPEKYTVVGLRQEIRKRVTHNLLKQIAKKC